MIQTLESAAPSDWFEDRANLALLCRWLIREQAYGADDLIYAIEKPWKFGFEFQLAREDAAQLLNGSAVR